MRKRWAREEGETKQRREMKERMKKLGVTKRYEEIDY